MTNDSPFRWLFIVIFLGAVFISGSFRRRARQLGGTIPRAREGAPNMLLRLLVAAPLYLSFLAYMLNPQWMDWSSWPLPAWLRWLGAGVGLGTLPVLYWVMVSIGKNISETYLTKESHALVTHGPYRWIRHPLYTVATGAFVSLGVVASNWFIMAIALVAFLGIVALVVPKEENELIRKFGSEYEAYQKRTGRFIPRPFLSK
jgi:protein-S-isoprenylcysteine O-methyltransferase Ste14